MSIPRLDYPSILHHTTADSIYDPPPTNFNFTSTRQLQLPPPRCLRARADYQSGYKYGLEWLPPARALTLHPDGVTLPYPPSGVSDVAAVIAAAGTSGLPGTGPTGASTAGVGGGIIPLGASDRGNASSSDVFLTIRVPSSAGADPNAGDSWCVRVCANVLICSSVCVSMQYARACTHIVITHVSKIIIVVTLGCTSIIICHTRAS